MSRHRRVTSRIGTQVAHGQAIAAPVNVGVLDGIPPGEPRRTAAGTLNGGGRGLKGEEPMRKLSLIIGGLFLLGLIGCSGMGSDSRSGGTGPGSTREGSTTGGTTGGSTSGGTTSGRTGGAGSGTTTGGMSGGSAGGTPSGGTTGGTTGGSAGAGR
jgi:hypothetical protein